MREQGRRAALCGMLTALAIVILLLGSMVPLATFCCPILSMIALLPIQMEYGSKCGFTVYCAVGVLSLLMVPDFEVALFFLFFGYYPALQPYLNRIRHGFLRFGAKFLICNGSIAGMGICLYLLMGPLDLQESFFSYTLPFAAVLLFSANLTFFLLDFVLRRFSLFYRFRIRKRIFRR